MDKSAFVGELANLRAGSTFLTLKGYHNAHSEVADYSLIFHMSYKNALEKSLAIVEGLSLTTDLDKQAQSELLTSFKTSLLDTETIKVEDLDDGYTRFFDSDGVEVKGVKLHDTSNTLHLYGLVVHKRVLMPGIYPKGKVSRPLTIAKDKLRSLCPVGKFRQFKITPDQVNSIQVQGLSLLPPE